MIHFVSVRKNFLNVQIFKREDIFLQGSELNVF